MQKALPRFLSPLLNRCLQLPTRPHQAQEARYPVNPVTGLPFSKGTMKMRLLKRLKMHQKLKSWHGNSIRATSTAAPHKHGSCLNSLGQVSRFSGQSNLESRKACDAKPGSELRSRPPPVQTGTAPNRRTPAPGRAPDSHASFQISGCISPLEHRIFMVPLENGSP